MSEKPASSVGASAITTSHEPTGQPEEACASRLGEGVTGGVTEAEAKRIDEAMFEAFDELTRQADEISSSDDGMSYVARMTKRVQATLEAREAAAEEAHAGLSSAVAPIRQPRQAGTR